MKKFFNFLYDKLSFNKFKIRNKLVLTYSFLIFLAISIVSTFSYYNSVRIIKDKSIHYTLGILEQISNNIDTNLKQIDLSSYIIFSNPNIISILQYGKSSLISTSLVETFKAENLLTDVMFSRQDIESIFLYDKDGKPYKTRPFVEDIPFEAVYQIALDNRGPFVWLDVDKEHDIIPAVRLVRNSVMQPIGVLQMNIRVSVIRDLSSREITKMNGQVLIVNSRNVIMSSQDKKLLGNKLDERIFSKLGKTAGYNRDKVNGIDSIVAYYPSKFNDWMYIGIIPMSEITKEASSISQFSLVICLISIILFIFITYFIITGILKPIHQITRHMKEVRIGDWNPQIRYSGRDEILYLSQAFNGMVNRINSLVDDVVEQKSRGIQQELKALQAQINPHFLYNTLEVLNWMARSRNFPEMGVLIKALSDMMRYSISNGEEIVTIEEEITHVHNYTRLQMARYADTLRVNFDISDEILDFSIVKLTLQPIVENALEHGFKNFEGQQVIQITGIITNKKIRFQIIDNGVGMDEKTVAELFSEKIKSKDERHTRIGVYNVNRRLKLEYGDEFGLKVYSRLKEGTTVEVWIPIKE